MLEKLIDQLAGLIIFCGLQAFIATMFIDAPYGKFHRKGFGPAVNGKLGWIVFESVSMILFPFIVFQNPLDNPKCLVAFLWTMHYVHRTLILPLRSNLAPTTLPVVLCAIIFNCMNATANAYSLILNAVKLDLLFYVGLTIFIFGMTINIHSDNILLGLQRKRKGKEYFLPNTGMFRYCAAANYFGEIIEWFGWFVMTRSLAGFSFFMFTCCNLIPRGLSQRRFYLAKFKEYPSDRKAVIPFIL